MLCYMETVSSMGSHHPTCICKLRTRAMLSTSGRPSMALLQLTLCNICAVMCVTDFTAFLT